jgi:hypothetical protein
MNRICAHTERTWPKQAMTIPIFLYTYADQNIHIRKYNNMTFKMCCFLPAETNNYHEFLFIFLLIF